MIPLFGPPPPPPSEAEKIRRDYQNEMSTEFRAYKLALRRHKITPDKNRLLKPIFKPDRDKSQRALERIRATNSPDKEEQIQEIIKYLKRHKALQ